MAKHSKTLQLMATKLEVSEDERILSKAAEFERLLQTRSTFTNLSDTSKAVICLDLASTLFGTSLDLKSAMKYSGLKSSMYTNNKKTIENILELNKDTLSVPVLCLSLQCTGVQELAQRILDQYQNTAKMDIDITLPQYVCMAVYQACRINKVKVSKSKLVDKSRLKSTQWSKLDAEWSKFVDENFAVAKKKSRVTKKQTEDAEPIEDKMEVDIIPKKEDLEPQIEVYEDWKRRILQTAYKQLEKDSRTPKTIDKRETKKKEKHIDDVEMVQEKDGCIKDDMGPKERSIKLILTPRRSPRKTPQKFEPYTSPSKGKGVRLLFAK